MSCKTFGSIEGLNVTFCSKIVSKVKASGFPLYLKMHVFDFLVT